MVGELLLIRHAVTEHNVANRWQGWTESPLTEQGRAHALAAGEQLRSRAIAQIVSSDLGRASETAALIAEVLDVGAVGTDARLRERNVAAWSGLTNAEISVRYPDEFETWQVTGRLPASHETNDMLVARVFPAIAELLERATDNGTILVVSHGGVLRTLAEHLGAPHRALPNLAGYVVVDRDGPSVGAEIPPLI